MNHLSRRVSSRRVAAGGWGQVAATGAVAANYQQRVDSDGKTGSWPPPPPPLPAAAAAAAAAAERTVLYSCPKKEEKTRAGRQWLCMRHTPHTAARVADLSIIPSSNRSRTWLLLHRALPAASSHPASFATWPAAHARQARAPGTVREQPEPRPSGPHTSWETTNARLAQGRTE